MLLCIIIYSYLVSHCASKIIKQRRKTGSMRTGNWTVLTTTEVVSSAPLLFDSVVTTFVVDNKANESVFKYICPVIGPLIGYNVTLDTANGN